jgi:putative aminopeptidase FrvX
MDGAVMTDGLDIDLLTRLCETPGAPGREERIRGVVIDEVAPLVDDVSVDPMGSVAATRRGGGGPRVMLAAHMDELGFMVTHVDDQGFIRVIPLGGFDPKTKIAQRVIVHGTEDLLGVMGAKPIHIMTQEERKKLPKPDDHYIDVGLPADRVREIVRAGDVVTRERTLARLGDLITCKSLDNRAGLYVMIRALRMLAEHPCEIVAVATTQEEVGLRGARVAAQRLRPDIGLAIDITLANDGPGAKPHERVTTIGGGAAIKAYDSGVIVPRVVITHLERVADERGIPHQVEIMSRGGTDTRELQLAGDGALAGCVSIPTRYVHQVVETCDPGDLEAAAALVAAFCETAHELVP